jgi:hypothetical protein
VAEAKTVKFYSAVHSVLKVQYLILPASHKELCLAVIGAHPSFQSRDWQLTSTMKIRIVGLERDLSPDMLTRRVSVKKWWKNFRQRYGLIPCGKHQY